MPKVPRLYQYFNPINYSLELTPSTKDMVFSGRVTIHGRLTESTNKLKLHAKGLQIDNAALEDKPLDFKVDARRDEIVVSLPADTKGEISVSLEFSGQITKQMHGLYPCFTNSGEIILATQFESHHAREVFPCIDEPEAKATFDLTLITPPKLVVLGNTPIASQKTKSGIMSTVFEKTPIMSSYLLAFVIGNLHSIKGKTANGTEVRIWASNDHRPESLNFALDTSIKTIEFFNNYFKTPYPLAKCDNVALPDFSSGAMENWGLVTYREGCLLVDPQKTSANTKEYVATVIAHELSHQWFGNLVTMKWWDDLWLNESFATLMEYLAIDAIYPEWEIMLTFASQEGLGAFWRDSTWGVQAVHTKVDHPDEISTLFDPSIVYGKGARLLLMARNYIGDAAFRRGLQQYFKKHAYQNTVGSDLWGALSAASGKDVSAFMSPWISQPGFPLLSVSQNGSKIQLSQRRFTMLGHASASALWPVPLSPSTVLNTEILNEKNHAAVTNDAAFVRFNTESAHANVRYTTKWQREQLANQIAENELSPSEKLLALNDSLMQARAGICSITETLELLSAFSEERHETVWNVISLCLADARRLVEENVSDEKSMKRYVYGIIETLYDELGWNKKNDEPLNDTKVRGTILSLASYSDNPSVKATALAEYAKYSEVADMPADTRHILLAAGVKFGDQAIFERLYVLYPKSVNAEEQQDLCGALCSTRKKSNIRRLLNNLTNGDFVRLQDVDRWIVYLLRNRWAREATWKWITENWGWIETNFSSDMSYDHYPRYAGSVFSTKEWQERYLQFFTPLKEVIALKRSIEMGAEEIATRVAWRERDEKALMAWLKAL